MKKRLTRIQLALLVGLLPCLLPQAEAQLIRAPLDRGFARTSSITMTVDEMLGSQKRRTAEEPIQGPGYPDLWIAEVQFKPVRYRRMQVVDPKTGDRNTELVWYMVYRVIPRDYTELAGDSRDDLVAKLSDISLQPQNTVDEVQRYSLQIPRFVLRTDDAETQQEYADEVNLEIQKQVLRREFRRTSNLKLMNSVQAITEVVDAVSVENQNPLANALYGVAVWRNVDARTDYFTVTMTGFSNAYRVSQVDGETVFEHKVIEQRFGRPGDEYQQHEAEFRIIDQARLKPNGDIVVFTETSESTFRVGRPAPAFVAKLRKEFEDKVAAGKAPEQSWPSWHYRKREASVNVPEFDRILRNAKNDAPDDAAAAQ